MVGEIRYPNLIKRKRERERVEEKTSKIIFIKKPRLSFSIY
jgi:hypothetical protein